MHVATLALCLGCRVAKQEVDGIEVGIPPHNLLQSHSLEGLNEAAMYHYSFDMSRLHHPFQGSKPRLIRRQGAFNTASEMMANEGIAI